MDAVDVGKAKAEFLVVVMQQRYQALPPEVESAIQDSAPDQLKRWLEIAMTKDTLDDFRAQAGI